MARAIIYLRVSTSKQHEENQLPALQNLAARFGYGSDDLDIFSEQESAWRAGHQTELKRATDLLKSGQRKYQHCFVWALDRLCREGSEAILAKVRTFKELGCKVISDQEKWTEAPGELEEVLYAIAGWAARMESQRRSERTKAGINKPGVRERVGKRGKDKGKRKRTGYLLRYAKG